MESNKDRMETHPKWVNPCGIPSDNAQMAQNMDAPQVTDQELLKSIIGQAKISLTKADRFKDDYARRVFSNNNFQQLHDLWKEKHYQWLPSFDDVPKNLGEDVSQDVLDEAKDETLLNVYRSLQKIAVGLEQIVWDQEDRNGEFLENFRAAEYNLRALLCEIQMALYNRGVPIESDVVREWMPCEFRNMNDDTSRNLRDFFIYRDYMNALEYTRQVFEHLKGKL